MIELDRRLWCRLWASGKHKPIAWEIINHNKPILKCFSSWECTSNTGLGGVNGWYLTYEINYNVQLLAQHNQGRRVSAENVHIYDFSRPPVQFMAARHKKKDSSDICISIPSLRADKLNAYAVQFCFFLRFTWQNCSAMGKMTSNNDQSSQTTEHEWRCIFPILFLILPGQEKKNISWMKRL